MKDEHAGGVKEYQNFIILWSCVFIFALHIHVASGDKDQSLL
jgi:hypothetical protein